jgi:hypothetical protein
MTALVPPTGSLNSKMVIAGEKCWLGMFFSLVAAGILLVGGCSSSGLRTEQISHFPPAGMCRVAVLPFVNETDFNVGDVLSPITPVYIPVGDINLDAMILMKLRSLGVFVTGVMYPVVPKGVVLFRMIPTAAHSDEDIDITLNAFRKVRDSLKLDLKTGKRG